MGDFKWRHFRGEIILWAVRWYCEYGISYRELEEMMTERGVAVDHTTIYRWVQQLRTADGEAPEVVSEKPPSPELARGRDLCEGQRAIGLSLSRRR